MNANRLINMVLRMVLKKGINMAARRTGGGAGGKKGRGGANPGQQTAKLHRQAQRLTRKM